MRHSLRTGREELTVLRFGILGDDSLFLALLTMGEGYQNYHHEFQHDYRNGVKPWQFDPTKWLIWTLSKLGLTLNLRRIPADKIESAQAQTRNASC
jgi:stearoyl-CoA desaturase (Delta-9 desaturase)